MEQGIRLLIQLVIEFAPVIASFIQKRMEASSDTTNYEIPLALSPSDENLNIATLSPNYEVGLAQEKRLQQQLVAYHNQTLLNINQKARETALKLPEINKILESWPLRLYPSQILESYSNNGHIPLKIFLAPPQLGYDRFAKKTEVIPEMELMLAEGLREFINKYYSLHNSVRPTEFLAGAWDSKRFHSESSIKALFSMLKTEPILILESEHDGDYLNFRIAYWGLGQEKYYYKTISRLPYKKILEDSAKNRALEWKKIRDELLSLGENLEEINNIGKDNVRNLAILEKSEKWQNQGIDINKLSLEYEINHQDFARLCQVLINCHCLIASWVADIYHLIHYDVPPLLPELLGSLLNESLDLQSVQAIATGYQHIYQALEQERRYWIPELALQLAVSLSYLSDRSWAREQVEYSINTWLQLRQVLPQEVNNPLQAMQSVLRIEDREYLAKLKEYFTVVDDRQSILEVDSLLQAIAHLNQQPSLESATLYHTLTGHEGNVSSIAFSKGVVVRAASRSTKSFPKGREDIASDGETLVSGCADKTIKVWNIHRGEVIRTLSENLGEISSVAVSPDGNYLAVGSFQHPKSNVKVWHLKTGKLLHTLLGHQKPVNVVVISPDGQILASGSHKIKIWDLHKSDRICTLWHSCTVDAAAISPDGTILASGSSDSKIRLWNPRTGDPLRTLTGHTSGIKSLAISPDGKILFSGSADTSIKSWHLNTGKLLYTLAGHSDEVKSLAVSPDSEILFSGSADTTIKMWCLATGALLHTITGHLGTVNSIALSADGKFLASGSSDRTIKIWQIVV